MTEKDRSVEEDDNKKYQTVTLSRTVEGRLGFKIRTLPAKNGHENETVTLAYGMSSPLPNDESEGSNKLWNNDRILSVNGKMITYMNQTEVVTLLKDGSCNNVTLLLYPRFGELFHYSSGQAEDMGQKSHKPTSRRSRSEPAERKNNHGDSQLKQKRTSRRRDEEKKSTSSHKESKRPESHERIRLNDITPQKSENRYESKFNSKLNQTPPFTTQTPNSVSADDLRKSRKKPNTPSSSTYTGFLKSLFRSRSHCTLNNRKLSSFTSSSQQVDRTGDGAVSPIRSRSREKSFGSKKSFPDTGSKIEMTPRENNHLHSRQSSTQALSVNRTLVGLFDRRKSFENQQEQCKRFTIGSNCRCSRCSQTYLEWQEDVLRSPHLVQWKPETQVVFLERRKKETLGFTFKVKIGKNRDGSPEVFILVDSIRKGSIADEQLSIGDWIRSVNYKPLHTAKEASNLNRYMDKSSKVRFIVQQPETFPNHKKKSSNTEKHSSVSNGLDSPLKSKNGFLHKANSETTFTSHNNTGNDSNSKPAPSCSELSLLNGYSNKLNETVPSVSSPVDMNISLTESCEMSNLHLASSIPKRTPSPGVHISYIKNNPSTLNEYVSCPWRQIFIVGSESLLLAQIMFPSEKDTIFSSWIDKNCKFFHFKSCAIRTRGSPDKTTTAIVDHDSNKDGASFPVILSQWFCSHTHISAEDVYTSIEQSVNGDSSINFTPSFNTQTVDLDIFVIFDSHFFLTCCHPFFNSASIFFVAFDMRKFLHDVDHYEELSLVESTVRSIKSFSNSNNNRLRIRLVSVLDKQPGDDIVHMTTQLHTLFYEHKDSTLNHHPELTVPLVIAVSSKSPESSTEMRYLHDILLNDIFSSENYFRFRIACLLVWGQVERMKRRSQFFITVGNLVHCVNENVIDMSERLIHSAISELVSCGLLTVARSRSKQIAKTFESTDVLLADHAYVIKCIQSLIVNLSIEVTLKKHLNLSNKHLILSSVSGNSINQALAVDEKDANIWMSVLKNLKVVLQLYHCDDTFIFPYFSTYGRLTNQHPPSVNNENSDIIDLVFDRSISYTLFIELVISLGWTYHHADVVIESLTQCRVANNDLTILMKLHHHDKVIRVTTMPRENSELPQSFQHNLNEAYHDVFQFTDYHVTETLVNGITIASNPSLKDNQPRQDGSDNPEDHGKSNCFANSSPSLDKNITGSYRKISAPRTSTLI